ncbi:hypothetical protein BC833DRAFT_417885 [Globomyces pollinis-pini]|nr:hypothetical protein BC833DRAFT_417885 [Globomyces pollinis-pini]
MTDYTEDNTMEDLFGPLEDTNNPPKGLSLHKHALNNTQLNQMLQFIKDQNWFNELKSRNQVMKFGELDSIFEPLDTIGFDNLPHSICSRYPLFDQLIANDYQPGEGLIPHIDLARFMDGILIATLLGTCIMEFTNDFYKYSVFLEPGDVVILTDESRYQWKHGIPARTFDTIDGKDIHRTRRISITLRKMILDDHGISS